MKKIIALFSIFCVFQSNAQKSLNLDGVNDAITTNYAGVLGRTNRTFEAWVKVPTNAPSRNLCILDYGRNAVGSRNTLLINASRAFAYISGGTNANMSSSSTINLNEWVHVALVINNGTGTMYINGVQSGSSNLSTVNTPSGGTNLRIGYRVPGGSNNLYFSGHIDELRVWNTALTSSEIRSWMCKEVNNTHSKFSNLQLYYKADTLSGSTVRDFSGNSRNGTRVGATWVNNGAPVGDESVNQYGGSYNLSLKHPDGDSLKVNNVSGLTNGVHLYYRKGKPNATSIPVGINSFDTTRHWGVHVVGSSSARYNAQYYFAANNHIATYGGCSNDLLYRASNAATSWSTVNAISSAGTYSLTSQPSREFLVGYKLSGKPTITSPFGKDTVPICSGDTAFLSNATTGLTYQWLKNGSVLPSDTLPTLKVLSTGNYSLIVSNGTICNDTSNTLYVANFNKPNVSLAPIPSTCSNEFSVQLSGGIPAGGSYSSAFSSGNLFVVNNSGPGQFKVTYKFTDANGCSDTSSQLLTVHAAPTVSLAAKGAVCEDSAAHALTGGMPSGGTYSIMGNTVTQFNPSALGAGTHVIRYEYTDANQCSGVDSISTVVHALPNVQFSLRVKSFCENDEFFGLDGGTPTPGVYAGTGVSGFNFIPKSAGAGKHPIRYRHTDRTTGCSNSAIDTITVFSTPSKPTVTQNGNILSSSSASSYQWFDKNGAISGETNQTFSPKKDGSYYVVITGAGGCESEASDEFDYSTVGINLRGAAGIRIYPNPASEQLNIDLELNDALVKFKIVSLTGQVVENGYLTSGKNTVDVSSFNSGLYLLQLKGAEGNLETIRLVVE